MTLRPGCRFQLVFLQAWHSTTGHWVSSSLAFAMSASPCDSVLATPTLPHFALPTCYVHSPVSLPAKSVGLVGLARYLPYIVLWTRFIPPFHGARRTTSYPTAPRTDSNVRFSRTGFFRDTRFRIDTVSSKRVAPPYFGRTDRRSTGYMASLSSAEMLLFRTHHESGQSRKSITALSSLYQILPRWDAMLDAERTHPLEPTSDNSLLEALPRPSVQS